MWKISLILNYEIYEKHSPGWKSFQISDWNAYKGDVEGNIIKTVLLSVFLHYYILIHEIDPS